MLDELLKPETQKFIAEHRNADLHKLLLNRDKYPGIPVQAAVDQIMALNKALNKIPTWAGMSGIILPPLLSIEQCSSEKTAEYKFRNFSGKIAVDLAGGTGIDTFYLAKKFQQVIYVEKNEALSEIAHHNFRTLGVNNITVKSISAEEYLENSIDHLDLVYIDPSRRKEGEKVFKWQDLSPNVLDLEKKMTELATTVLIKGSPMADIKQSINLFNSLKEVDIIAIRNEVKEVNIVLSGTKSTNILVRASNIKDDHCDELIIKPDDHFEEEVRYDECRTFLYEPNNAIMKSGGFNQISKMYSVAKLHPHTHLYTSNKIISGFPGRAFEVLQNQSYSKKHLKAACPEGKANITVRNFPATVEEIRKKTGLKDGGSKYLIAYTDIHNTSKVAICEQIFEFSEADLKA